MNCTELRCARIRRHKSTSEMAKLIGKSDAAWNMRERGDVAVSLDESVIIGKALELTEEEFSTIFFDGELPFRKKIGY